MNARDHLQALVTALDGAFISVWQSTAAWQQQLDAAREYLDGGVLADPCPQCERGGVCKTPACGRLRSSELMRLYGGSSRVVSLKPNASGFGPPELVYGKPTVQVDPTLPPDQVVFRDPNTGRELGRIVGIDAGEEN